MDLSEYCEIFGIKNEYVNLKVTPDAVERLNKNGYVILSDVVDKKAITEMRSFWIKRKVNNRFSQSISFGEPNYSHSFYGRYTRHFEFYWNPPSSPLTYSISLLLHYLRNTLLGFSPLYGLSFEPKKVGIYLALTHYPVNSGEMAVHVDPNYFLPVHYVLPLTFKGEDYDEGGLFIVKDKNEIDVESQLDSGSLLLFKGSVPHGVKKIQGKKGQLGRLQMFAIPTVFDGREKRSSFRSLLDETYGRIKYTLYGFGKGYKEDYKNFR